VALRRLVCIAFVGAIALVPGTASASAAPPPRYTVTPIAPHPSSAFGLNASGDVVGTWLTGVFPSEGFLWSAGRLRTLSGLFDAFDVNDRRHVAGRGMFEGTGARAVLWRDGRPVWLRSLAPPAGEEPFSEALALNNADQVVGFARARIGVQHAVIWTPAPVDIDPGRADVGSEATDINQRGEVVVDESFGGAYVWKAGVATRIPGMSISYAINDAGSVAGIAGSRRGVLWRGGRVTTLDADFTPVALNDAEQIVGFRSDGAGALLWQDGRMYDLNRLATAPAGWVVERPLDINDRGEIVAEMQNGRGQQRAVLLRPTAAMRTCAGRQASIVGTSVGEVIRGTRRADVIWAGGGADRVYAGSGDDVVCGNRGRDVVRGGWGADTLIGRFGADRLHGGAGRDALNGGTQDDALDGGTGRDTCNGDVGTDTAIRCETRRNVP
jgi:hypothetical protein